MKTRTTGLLLTTALAFTNIASADSVTVQQPGKMALSSFAQMDPLRDDAPSYASNFSRRASHLGHGARLVNPLIYREPVPHEPTHETVYGDGTKIRHQFDVSQAVRRFTSHDSNNAPRLDESALANAFEEHYQKQGVRFSTVIPEIVTNNVALRDLVIYARNNDQKVVLLVRRHGPNAPTPFASELREVGLDEDGLVDTHVHAFTGQRSSDSGVEEMENQVLEISVLLVPASVLKHR